MKIDGIAALVAGGASGLGEATVRALVERGARVTVVDRDRDRAESLASELGDVCRAAEADVTDAESVRAAVDGAVGAFGPLRVAVCCAGIGMAGRTVGRDGSPLDPALFSMVVQVNLLGTFHVASIAAGRMVSNEPDGGGERGVLIHTASIAAYDGQVGQVAYAASKGGVVGMTLPMARDLARHGIRCCTIAPGVFATPMMMMASDSVRDALAAATPFPSRMGDPAEYAALALHVVDNPMLNGETLRLDAALRMPTT